jgi:hypothetical protein
VDISIDTMPGVKVVNGTQEDILLSAGTGGIYRLVKTIRRGGEHFLKVGQNETYCEYVFVISQSKHTVTLTSDDCIEYEKVEIMYDGSKTPKLYTVPTRRNSRNEADTATGGQSGKDLLLRLAYKLGIFKKERGVGGGTVAGDGAAEGGRAVVEVVVAVPHEEVVL